VRVRPVRSPLLPDSGRSGPPAREDRAGLACSRPSAMLVMAVSFQFRSRVPNLSSIPGFFNAMFGCRASECLTRSNRTRDLVPKADRVSIVGTKTITHHRHSLRGHRRMHPGQSRNVVADQVSTRRQGHLADQGVAEERNPR
jgi:hypothetical protein